MFRVGCEKTQPGELINGGILEETEFRVSDTASRNDFHIDLYALSGMSHLLIGLWNVLLFRLLGRKQPQPAHDPEQAFRAAGVAPGLQAMPQLDHAQRRISAAHIADELQLFLGVPVWMAVRASGLADQRRRTSVPALLPEVDVGAAFVVLSACSADTVLFGVFHYVGLSMMCYKNQKTSPLDKNECK